MKGFLGILVLFCGAAFAQPSRAFHSELAGSLPHADSVPVSVNSVTNGASFQTGIAAGSWVTIKGANLANIAPDGRIWRNDEIVNGNLPTQLDGVTVTVNGKPAYVYYISPGQINIQAPSDSAVGPVTIVVNNNGSTNNATAQMQQFSPAFFQFGGSNAIATRYPDNALIGNPNAIPGTVAAKPGDILILWGTGFGPTNPPTPAGVVVSGAPAVTTSPTITLNGSIVAPLVATPVLSPGSAGLYQVPIQLPANTPLGDVTIQASVGGFISPSTVHIFVSQ
jgi:uncharacterized protein (TIGR03437 family)